MVEAPDRWSYYHGRSVDRVLRYKVKKALAEGFVLRSYPQNGVDHEMDKSIHELAELIGRPHQHEEVAYIVAQLNPEKSIHEWVPRTYATIEELVVYAEGIIEHRGWDALENYRNPYLGACACSGPQYGEPLCNCAMVMSLRDHLDDVKQRIAEERNLD